MSEFEPHWILTEGSQPVCCQECGSMVSKAWLWFATLTKWTICWCEHCVEEKLDAA